MDLLFFHRDNQSVQQCHIENYSPPIWSNITTKNRTQIFDRMQMLNKFIIYFWKKKILNIWKCGGLYVRSYKLIASTMTWK